MQNNDKIDKSLAAQKYLDECRDRAFEALSNLVQVLGDAVARSNANQTQVNKSIEEAFLVQQEANKVMQEEQVKFAAVLDAALEQSRTVTFRAFEEVNSAFAKLEKNHNLLLERLVRLETKVNVQNQ